jgi:2-phosphoglycerate kinase
MSKIVIIAAGSFHGKSLIALNAASTLKFSGVVTTDTIRNVLLVEHPNKTYLATSTYLLSESDLAKQKNDVSEVIKKIINIYRRRGEHIIVEGMHFSDSFLEWSSRELFCGICLNNTLSLAQRLIYKNLTRSKLRLNGKFTDKEEEFGLINENNVNESLYMHNQIRIGKIHSDILVSCKKNGFKLIEYDNIQLATEITISAIKEYLKY